MQILSLDNLPEIIISNAETSQRIAELHHRKKVRKIASRLYTTIFDESPVAVVRRHLWEVIGSFLPGALIADRTALENRPAEDGSVFVVSARKLPLELPGITVRPRRGIGPLESDKPFIAGLFLSSTARAFLENMRPSRARKSVPRTFSIPEMEFRLDTILRGPGEAALLHLRDEMRTLAPKLDAGEEFKRIDTLIGGLLGTREFRPKTEVGKARRQGSQFDPERILLFEKLHTALRNTAPPLPRRLPKKVAEGTSLPFFEAYFSNFIEGTEFLVEEAERIIFEGEVPTTRPEDAHDILGTYRVVSNARKMTTIPRDTDHFLEILKSHHADILGGRSEKLPGTFKTRENRAGGSVFVQPDLVEGTLRRGWTYLQSLDSPFQKAIYMMFLVSEVHPFEDGNGRAARSMMNAELVSAGECRIVVPTVYRNNYLQALKALTQSSRPEALIRMLDFAQKYTHSIPWEPRSSAKQALQATYAFNDPNEADLNGVRLRLPY